MKRKDLLCCDSVFGMVNLRGSVISLVYRSVAGLIRSPECVLLSGFSIEMLFLDVSASSSNLLAFFIISKGARRWPALANTGIAAPADAAPAHRASLVHGCPGTAPTPHA